MTRSLARELGSRLKRVNDVAPGFLGTEISSELDEGQRCQIERRTNLGRLGHVKEVVSAFRFLVSVESLLISGQVIPSAASVRVPRQYTLVGR